MSFTEEDRSVMKNIQKIVCDQEMRLSHLEKLLKEQSKLILQLQAEKQKSLDQAVKESAPENVSLQGDEVTKIEEKIGKECSQICVMKTDDEIRVIGFDAIEKEVEKDSFEAKSSFKETLRIATRNNEDESTELLLKELANFAKITQDKNNRDKLQENEKQKYWYSREQLVKLKNSTLCQQCPNLAPSSCVINSYLYQQEMAKREEKSRAKAERKKQNKMLSSLRLAVNYPM